MDFMAILGSNLGHFALFISIGKTHKIDTITLLSYRPDVILPLFLLVEGHVRLQFEILGMGCLENSGP